MNDDLHKRVRSLVANGLFSEAAYRRLRANVFLGHLVAATVTVVGLCSATVVGFLLGPILGVPTCIVLGCSSVFVPLLTSNLRAKRLYVAALQKQRPALSHSSSVAISAVRGQPGGQ